MATKSDLVIPTLAIPDQLPPAWLVSTFSIRRNIQGQHFPRKMEAASRKRLYALMQQAILAPSFFVAPTQFASSDLSGPVRETLLEQFFLDDCFVDLLTDSGGVIDASGKFLILLNMKDHFCWHFVNFQENGLVGLQECAKQLLLVAQKLPFAFHPRFGYLTASPTHMGTGLSVRLFLHIPALLLTQKIVQMIALESDEDIVLQDWFGAPFVAGQELVGDFLVLTNAFAVGCSEEKMVQKLEACAKRLALEEEVCRREIKQSDLSEAKDSVSRAIGLLRHSLKLSMGEAFSALSRLRLGIEVGWVEGLSSQQVLSYLFNARRAHLLKKLSTPNASQEEPFLRAKFVKELFSDNVRWHV